MNKIKDFIYDKSDIFVALLIVSIACLVIFSRIDSILAYPKTFKVEPRPVVEAPVNYEGNYTTKPSVTVQTEVEEIKMLAVYINYGESLQVIADNFVKVGLFKTSDEFFETVEAANAGTSIKTGNFIIPSNATPEEVLEIITKPGL